MSACSGFYGPRMKRNLFLFSICFPSTWSFHPTARSWQNSSLKEKSEHTQSCYIMSTYFDTSEGDSRLTRCQVSCLHYLLLDFIRAIFDCFSVLFQLREVPAAHPSIGSHGPEKTQTGEANVCRPDPSTGKLRSGRGRRGCQPAPSHFHPGYFGSTRILRIAQECEIAENTRTDTVESLALVWCRKPSRIIDFCNTQIWQTPGGRDHIMIINVKQTAMDDRYHSGMIIALWDTTRLSVPKNFWSHSVHKNDDKIHFWLNEVDDSEVFKLRCKCTWFFIEC